MTDRRTAIDWAHQIKFLVDVRHKDAEKIVLRFSAFDMFRIFTGLVYQWIYRYVTYQMLSDAVIVLVEDNLNTHCPASLYKAFSPEEARRMLDKLEFHYTPKHGSWLDMAEIELSILSRQCLDRRIPDQETLRKEVKAWEDQRNNSNSTMEWRFKTEDARIKLKRLYPTLPELHQKE